MIIQNKNLNEVKIISSLTTDTYKIVDDGKRKIIRRLREELADNLSYIAAFKSEVAQCQTLRHENLLGYRDLIQDEKGFSVEMENCSGITLKEYLHNNPSFVTQTKEIERIINEICSVLTYLHEKGIYQIDLSPQNILLEKSSLTVKVVNPLSFYLKCEPTVFGEPSSSIAPELVSNSSCDLGKCDIYTLGELVNFLYAMSAPPYKFKAAIQKAIRQNPDKRCKSITAFKRKVNTSQGLLKGFMIMIGMLITAFICFCIFWGTSNELEPQIEFIKPTANAEYFYDSISGQGFYITDSTVTRHVEAAERSAQQQQREYELKASAIFKKDFTQKAEPVISAMYSRKNKIGRAHV